MPGLVPDTGTKPINWSTGPFLFKNIFKLDYMTPSWSHQRWDVLDTQVLHSRTEKFCETLETQTWRLKTINVGDRSREGGRVCSFSSSVVFILWGSEQWCISGPGPDPSRGFLDAPQLERELIAFKAVGWSGDARSYGTLSNHHNQLHACPPDHVSSEPGDRTLNLILGPDLKNHGTTVMWIWI